MLETDLRKPSPTGEYCCLATLNLYDSPTCEVLATQGARGRHLRIASSTPVESAIAVCLCEDDYPGWLPLAQVAQLEPAIAPYQPTVLSRTAIEEKLPQILAFAQAARQQPNHYLWGGTTAPNYDCSGLMQAAFSASGIWLPRDAYQQADFTQPIALEDLRPGDLIFFRQSTRINHVALYLGEGQYIHSSGKEMGRNGIGIDRLSGEGDRVSYSYSQQLYGAGRVVQSYQPQGLLRPS